MLERIVPLLRSCHREMPRHFRGPAPIFWVFQVLRDYAARLAEERHRLARELPRYLAAAERLEAAVGPVEVAFGHNDLLAANLIDDGARLWLVDWEYAGFNSPLFDLGGLASNNELSPELEERLLELYFDAPATADLRRRYDAMKCASLLREAMWSMVSELHLTVDFDYVGLHRREPRSASRRRMRRSLKPGTTADAPAFGHPSGDAGARAARSARSAA